MGAYHGDDVLVVGTADRNRASTMRCAAVVSSFGVVHQLTVRPWHMTNLSRVFCFAVDGDIVAVQLYGEQHWRRTSAVTSTAASADESAVDEGTNTVTSRWVHRLRR